MNILAIGDLVGESGVKKLRRELKGIIENNKIDFVIVNGENAAEGMGITKKIFNELLEEPIDVITMGNHTWAKKDIFSFIDHDKLIVPANYSQKCPGKGYHIYEAKGKRICVIELLGRTGMNVLSENPFNVVEKILEKVKGRADIIICEVHAEATAEKIAMGYFLDGKVSIVYGTHTHVQTADEEILANGTGYITDLGMTGPKYSVIGMDVETSIKRFNTTLPERYKIADGDKCILSGCIFEIDDNTNKTKSIKRIFINE